MIRLDHLIAPVAVVRIAMAMLATGALVPGALCAQDATVVEERADADALLEEVGARFWSEPPEQLDSYLQAQLAKVDAAGGAESPLSLGLLIYLGANYDRLGRHVEAEAALRRFLSAPAGIRAASGFADAVAWNELSFALASQGKGEEAEALAQAALAPGAGLPEDLRLIARRNLSLALSVQQRHEQAAELLEEIIADAGNADPGWLIEMHRALSDAQQEAGQFEAAAQAIEQVAALNRQLGVEDPDSLIDGKLLRALDARRKGDLASAGARLGEAVAIADEAGLPRDRFYIQLLENTMMTLEAAGLEFESWNYLSRFAAAMREEYGLTSRDALETNAFMFDRMLGDGFAYGETNEEMLALMQRVVAAHVEQFGEDSERTVAANVQLFNALKRLDRHDEAKALIERLIPIAERFDDAGETVFELREKYLEADALQNYPFQPERRWAALYDMAAHQLGPDDARTLAYAARLAETYFHRGKAEQARALYADLLGRLRRTVPDDDDAILDALQGLARSHAALGQDEDAITLSAEAAALAREAYEPGSASLQAVLVASAEVLAAAQDLDAADRFYAEALAMASDAGRARPDIDRSLAQLRFTQGRHAEAAALLEGLLARDDYEFAVRANASLLTRALLAQPETASRAIAPARRAIELVLSERERRGRSRLAFGSSLDPNVLHGDPLNARSRRFDERLLFARFADAAWSARGAPDTAPEDLHEDAFKALQEAMVSLADEELSRMAARRRASDSDAALGPLAQRRETLVARWNTLSTELSATYSNPDPAGGTTRRELAEEQNRVNAQLNALNTELRDRFPRYFDLIEPSPVDVDTLAAQLREGEALVLVMPTEFGTHTIVVRDGAVGWHRSSLDAAAVNAMVQKLRFDLGASVDVDPDLLDQWDYDALLAGRPGFDRTLAHRLYAELLEPLADRIAGADLLYMVPGGALTGLPLSVLVTAEPEGEDNDPAALRATRWLGLDTALVHLPSVQALGQLRDGAGGGLEGGEPFFGVGDPVLAGEAEERGPGRGTRSASAGRLFADATRGPNGLLVDPQALRAMERLPGTADELRKLQLAFGEGADTVLTGVEATESAVRGRDLSAVRVLAFATHGLTADPDTGIGEAGLVLTPPDRPDEQDDGYLSQSEVAALHLDADWAILSACNTATGSRSEGLSGLARAFFFAGARSLLASHWPVDDLVAPRLTVPTVELGREGVGRAEAFRRAMRAVVNDTSRDDGNASFAHPYFWAPFVLLGSAD